MSLSRVTQGTSYDLGSPQMTSLGNLKVFEASATSAEFLSGPEVRGMPGLITIASGYLETVSDCRNFKDHLALGPALPKRIFSERSWGPSGSGLLPDMFASLGLTPFKRISLSMYQTLARHFGRSASAQWELVNRRWVWDIHQVCRVLNSNPIIT